MMSSQPNTPQSDKLYKSVAIGHLDFVYLPRYKWPRNILKMFHEANHKQVFCVDCPICRLGTRFRQKQLNAQVDVYNALAFPAHNPYGLFKV